MCYSGRHECDRVVSQEPAIRRLLDRLIDVYRPEEVYLFGSRATGTARADSDYDPLVVVSDDTLAERLSVISAASAIRDLRIPADVFPCRRSAFEQRKNDVGTITYAAFHSGQRVYAA